MSHHRICCCGEPANAVVLWAKVAKFTKERTESVLSSPTDPALFPGGEEESWPTPPCTVPDFVLTCEPDCSEGTTTPSLVSYDCPDPPGGSDASRAWGTTITWDYVHDLWWFQDDPITLPFLEQETDSPTRGWYLVPVGGGASELVSEGTTEALTDVFEDTIDLYPAGNTADARCKSQAGESSDSRVVTARYKFRETWTDPPCAIKLFADSAGTSVEVTTTECIVRRTGPTTDTYTLSSGTLNDLFGWLDTKGLTPYAYTDGTSLNTTLQPHPATLLFPMAETTVPETGTKVKLYLLETGIPAVLEGTHDEAVAPYWEVIETDASPAATHSQIVPVSMFDGTEEGFANGCRAKYTNDWSAALYAGFDHFDDGNLYPFWGETYGGVSCRFGAVTSLAPHRWCEHNADTVVDPVWDQDPGDCWVGCVASKTSSLYGQDLLWSIQRV